MEVKGAQTTTTAPIIPISSTAPPTVSIKPNATALNLTSPTQNSVPVQTVPTVSPNVVTIPVSFNQADIYTYVSIKGSLHDRTCSVFGLNDAEVCALSSRFENGSTQIVNGVLVNASPMQMINTLSQIGYKVVCSTGDAEIVWTMQREV